MKPILYSIVRFIFKPFIFLLYRPKVYGKENLKIKDGIVLAGKHTSYLDCLALGYSTNRDLFYIVKKELHEGFKRHFFRLVGTIPVDRKTKANVSSMQRAIDILKKKNIIVIFPEGTINRENDDLLPFKKGAVSLAQKADAYVVPFGLKGKFKLFKYGSVVIRFGKPFKVNDMTKEEGTKKLENEVKKLMEE